MVSRYGVFPFASSLDHLGVLTRCVKDSAIVIDSMKGIDPKDMTSWDSKDISLKDACTSLKKDYKVCYVAELCNKDNFPDLDSELEEHLDNFHKTLDILKGMGVSVTEVHVDQKLLNAVYSVYRVIHSAEASSNLSNLTGIIFGPRGEGKNYIEMMKDYRTKGFSPLIKRRLVIGAYVLQEENKERYYRNAARLRRLIVDTWKKLYETYDAVIAPVGCGVAPRFTDLDKKKSIERTALDESLQIGNFGGFPSITIPNGFIGNLPVGINITGNCYKDMDVINLAYNLEAKMDYKGQIAKEAR